ncbi:MAG: hypothetical protein BPH100C_136 [Phage 5P_2]|nr:MAG: hypothetical protein BPH100C_136 [Phage 5P_2]
MRNGPPWHCGAKKNGFMPRGNNQYGADVSATYERGKETYFDAGAGKTGRVATGSGPASWAHDGTQTGIFDLNGNVWEWVSGLRLYNGEIQIIPDNNAADNTVSHAADSTAWKAILQDGSLVAPGTANTLKYDSTGADNGTSVDVGDIRVNTTIVNSLPNSYAFNTFETTAAQTGVTVPDLLSTLACSPWIRRMAATASGCVTLASACRSAVAIGSSVPTRVCSPCTWAPRGRARVRSSASAPLMLGN